MHSSAAIVQALEDSEVVAKARADLVAGHAQRAQIVHLAHAATLVDGDDVIRMPGVPLQSLHKLKGAVRRSIRH